MEDDVPVDELEPDDDDFDDLLDGDFDDPLNDSYDPLGDDDDWDDDDWDYE